jgi:hypothetical protein
VCPAAQYVAPYARCLLPDTLTCDSATPYHDCNGNVAGTLQCNCYSPEWICPEPPPCWADASTGCPTPTSIQAGAPCNEPGVTCPGSPTQCNGQTNYDAFSCDGGVWVDVVWTFCADAGVSD